MARTRGTARLPGEASQRGGGETSRTLESAMMEPSTTTPDVVVLDSIDEGTRIKELADPKKDLWLSTADGRYMSQIVDVRVGPHAELFPVHKAILTKSEFFSKALDGEFLESKSQSIDLPEEDPNIFSFLVAFLYEEKFVPIKPLASVLVTDPDKGKGREGDPDLDSASDDATDSGGTRSDDRYLQDPPISRPRSSFDLSARSRRRREQRRRRNERVFQQMQRKDGSHRAECQCAACTVESRPCWSCGAPRPQPPTNGYFHPPPPQPIIIGPNGYPLPHPHPRRPHRERRRGARNNVPVVEEIILEDEQRMSHEDLRTWSLAYSLSMEVYVCAERYCLQDFKSCIAAYVINSFEIAGMEAAVPAVLQSCKVLYNGVSSVDPLLKKVFARVGFLQARLWKNFPDETQSFFMESPELALLIMKEMVERRELDKSDSLPPMERPPPVSPFGPDQINVQQGPRRRYRPIYDD